MVIVTGFSHQRIRYGPALILAVACTDGAAADGVNSISARREQPRASRPLTTMDADD